MHIKVEHHHYLHGFDDEVKSLLHQIIKKIDKMGQELDTLTTEVSETATVIDSAVVLLKGLKAALDAAGTDPAKLAALSASLDSKQTELATAITENTPAAQP
jgi:hypothetical protein